MRPPPAGLHVHQWFVELDAVRTGNGYGANPLTFGEIDAFVRLKGLAPEPWEIEALRQMDVVRVVAINTPPGADVVSERPLTPELFGALFSRH